MFNKHGNSAPLVVAAFPDDYPTFETMYCEMITPMSLLNHSPSQFHAQTLVYEEKTE
jgi:hypothetical protein